MEKWTRYDFEDGYSTCIRGKLRKPDLNREISKHGKVVKQMTYTL